MELITTKALPVLFIIGHGFACFSDLFGGMESLDFIRREDGSQSDPHQLLPVEQIIVSLVGLAHGVIAFAFVIVYLGIGDFQAASAISLFLHTAWMVDLIYRDHIYQNAYHPDGTMSSASLKCIHGFWTVLSFILFIFCKKKKKRKHK